MTKISFDTAGNELSEDHIRLVRSCFTDTRHTPRRRQRRSMETSQRVSAVERMQLQLRDRASKRDAANFIGIVLGCIETKFCKYICV